MVTVHAYEHPQVLGLAINVALPFLHPLLFDPVVVLPLTACLSPVSPQLWTSDSQAEAEDNEEQRD